MWMKCCTIGRLECRLCRNQLNALAQSVLSSVCVRAHTRNACSVQSTGKRTGTLHTMASYKNALV